MKTDSGWTGGLYSLYRLLVGITVVVLFLQPLISGLDLSFASSDPGQGFLPDSANIFLILDSPIWKGVLLLFGSICGLIYGLGINDRISAPILFWLLASSAGYFLPIAHSELAAFGFIFLVHLFTPENPWGSWNNCLSGANLDWRLQKALVISVRLGIGYLFLIDLSIGLLPPMPVEVSILDILIYTSEVMFIVLLLIPKTTHLAPVFAILASILGFGFPVLLLSILGFDPSSFSQQVKSEKITVFYDGPCGLCHRWLIFVLSEAINRDCFRFTPIQGNTYAKLVGKLDEPPTTIVARLSDGTLLYKSKAIIHILRNLGPAWKLFGNIFFLVPRFISDLLYSLVAKIRYILFSRQSSTCPIIPEILRSSFLE